MTRLSRSGWLFVLLALGFGILLSWLFLPIVEGAERNVYLHPNMMPVPQAEVVSDEDIQGSGEQSVVEADEEVRKEEGSSPQSSQPEEMEEEGLSKVILVMIIFLLLIVFTFGDDQRRGESFPY